MADPTVLAIQNIKGPFAAIIANGADYTYAAGTITDGDTFVCTGREILLAKNDNVAAKTITIVSVDDETNRAENIAAYSIGASEFAVFAIGPIGASACFGTSGASSLAPVPTKARVAVLRLP